MLTLQNLKDMQPHTQIAKGVTVDNYTGINMFNSGQDLLWVAVRGEIHDWAIYIGLVDDGLNYIKRNGDKVCDKNNIKKLVPCDDEAFKMYRY
jgi:hypothetical protein